MRAYLRLLKRGVFHRTIYSTTLLGGGLQANHLFIGVEYLRAQN